MGELNNCKYINLKGTPCPVNFIRCCLELEDLNINELLKVDIDRGEPEQMVIPGIREAGHKVEIIESGSNWLRLIITCGVK